jgi:5-methylthioadenosine/S-adenosylhomocysteine deaminase
MLRKLTPARHLIQWEEMMVLHHCACDCNSHAQAHRPDHVAELLAKQPWSVLSRRRLLASGAAGIAAAIASAAPLPDRAQAQPATRSGLTLLKGGTVISVDPAIGDLPQGDVLIDGSRIAAIAPNIAADGANVIDAADMIVMPGFIDSHRHMWEGAIRNLIPDATLRDYLGLILSKYGPNYRPDDVYIGNLVSALSALDGGVTTIVDWSHIQNSPAHTDAAIRALQESGMRAMFGYGFPLLAGKPWWADTSHQYPQDIKRLRNQYFSTDDQLLTLALAATAGFGNMDIAAKEWGAARDVGARITVHASGKDQLVKLSKAIKLGADTTYVHCSGYGAEDWKLMADSGGSYSVSPGTEMLMDITMPLLQEALDVGVRPTLSIDAETNVPTTMFPQMQLCLAAQRVALTQRKALGEKDLPKMISARDVIEFATIEGAKACGLESKTGSLTPRKQADIVMLRKNAINVLPVNDPLAAIALGMDASNVDTVLVAGIARKRNGQLVGIDLKRVAALAGQSRDYLGSKVKSG